jgi:hypothetical protein
VKAFYVAISGLFLAGCSVFGKSNVETAPYTLLKADSSQQIEVRNYDSMVLVSADMSGDGRNSAFRKLFRYISGDNEGATEIAMTAPVLMDGEKDAAQGTEIAMTAPVFMGNQAGKSMMSFVMPKDFTLQTTPKPKDPTLQVTELKNYRVATIQFSGTLSDGNVETHTKILQDWLKTEGYIAIGAPVEAGYNGPMTLPMLRRNEILIEIK